VKLTLLTLAARILQYNTNYFVIYYILVSFNLGVELSEDGKKMPQHLGTI
jgi:hypothetical protein